MAASETYTTCKRVVDLTQEEYRELYRCNKRERGNMQSHLAVIRERKIQSAEAIMIRRRSDQRLIAWSLLHYWENKKARTAYFYVRREFRRKGYGTRLMKYVLRIEPDVLVVQDNKINTAFFKNFGWS